MNAIVIFDSLHGNTERIALAIGEGLAPLCEVKVLRTADVPAGTRADLLVPGGPTQRHGMSLAMEALITGLPPSRSTGTPVATFDTRYHHPRLLSGSAARSAAGRLRAGGHRLVAEPESFT